MFLPWFFPYFHQQRTGTTPETKDLQRRGLIKSKEFSGHHDFGPEDVQAGPAMASPCWAGGRRWAMWKGKK